MTNRFRVLLVDDGELDDVRDCLLALGAEFAHLRGGAVPAHLEPPRDLFITSTRHATLARAWPKQDASGHPVRIAVVSEDSGTLRATLRQMGFTGAVALDGGIRAWKEAGHPLESGKPAARTNSTVAGRQPMWNSSTGARSSVLR